MTRAISSEPAWQLRVDRPTPENACVVLGGAWRKENRLPDPGEVWRDLRVDSSPRRLTFDATRVTDWDSGLITFVIKVLAESKARGLESDRAGLPDGAQRLLHLAEAVPERHTGRAGAPRPWLE